MSYTHTMILKRYCIVVNRKDTDKQKTETDTDVHNPHKLLGQGKNELGRHCSNSGSNISQALYRLRRREKTQDGMTHGQSCYSIPSRTGPRVIADFIRPV